MSQLLPFLVIAAIGLWWWDSMRAREAAVAACRRACRTFDTQFLDDSVVLRGIRPRRDAGGILCVARLYRFEFTRTGEGRHWGYVRLLGRRVVDVHLDAAERPPVAAPPSIEGPDGPRAGGR